MNKHLKIKNIEISGVNNPLFSIKGIFYKPNSKLEFFIDDKKVEIVEENINDLLSFEYSFLFNSKSKKIRIIYINDNEKDCIYKIRTSKIKRRSQGEFRMD